MRIEHVAMYVNDLKAAKNFFEKYLGASANEGYHNKTTTSVHIFSHLMMVQGLR